MLRKSASGLITPGFLIHGFLVDQTSSIFGVWAALGALQTITNGGAPPFGMVSGAAGAAQTPKIDMFRSIKQPCIKNPGVY